MFCPFPPMKAEEPPEASMIELTRLNGSPLFVNCDLIKWAEAAPDTMLTLINGEKVVVHESCAEVVARIMRQRAHLFADAIDLIPGAGTLLHLLAAASVSVPSLRAVAAEASSSPPEAPKEGTQTG
jgi:flagellar protein FlbD